MNNLRVVLLAVNGVISTLGIFANILLLTIIYVATPKSIRTYSVLIVNYAITDLFTSTAQVLTIPRLITGNNTMLIVFYGACSELGPRWCLSSFFIETFGFQHGLNSILLSICYRYFSLLYGVPKRKPIIICCLLTCLPSLLPQLLLCPEWANQSEVQGLASKTPTDVTRGLSLAGIMNVSATLVQCTLILYILPWIPIVITINVLKNKMYALVRSRENVFSTETLRLHGNLIKALTTQSLTPLLHLVTYICYVVEQYIFPNIVTEFLMFMPIGILSIVTPIINIYYIRPYREQFKQCLGFRTKVVEHRSSKAGLEKR